MCIRDSSREPGGGRSSDHSDDGGCGTRVRDGSIGARVVLHARVARPDALQQIRLTATMLVHHFPDVLLRAIQESIAAEEAAERVLGGERNK